MTVGDKYSLSLFPPYSPSLHSSDDSYSTSLLCVYKNSSSSDWQRLLSESETSHHFQCAILCVSFIWRPLHLFIKSHPLLFLFMCYKNWLLMQYITYLNIWELFHCQHMADCCEFWFLVEFDLLITTVGHELTMKMLCWSLKVLPKYLSK